MLQFTVKLYLEALLITALIAFAISVLYILGYMARGQNKTIHQRQNKIFDVMLINFLSIPILSFATLTILIIIRSR